MKVIAYTIPDGRTALCVPSRNHDFDSVMAKDVPKDAMNVRVMEDTELPPTRQFRNAWTLTPDGIEVDMPKARDIHLDKIRAARDDALTRSDVEMVRAVEGGDAVKQAALVTKRQALRDLPQTVDLSAETPEELAAIWPEELT